MTPILLLSNRPLVPRLGLVQRPNIIPYGDPNQPLALPLAGKRQPVDIHGKEDDGRRPRRWQRSGCARPAMTSSGAGVQGVRVDEPGQAEVGELDERGGVGEIRRRMSGVGGVVVRRSRKGRKINKRTYCRARCRGGRRRRRACTRQRCRARIISGGPGNIGVDEGEEVAACDVAEDERVMRSRGEGARVAMFRWAMCCWVDVSSVNR